jgi:NADH-quinone oxidoreductase subunit F
VETLANVPFIVERGADWFLSIGKAPKNSGPKLYSLSGHVKRPGNYEAPMGLPLHELIYDLGGGMLRDDRPLKAVIPGGSSVPVLRADECEVDLDFDSLAAKGTMLGSAGVMVMDSGTCMVSALRRISHFYAHESCGQCTPCREGCGWMERILTGWRRARVGRRTSNSCTTSGARSSATRSAPWETPRPCRAVLREEVPGRVPVPRGPQGVHGVRCRS